MMKVKRIICCIFIIVIMHMMMTLTWVSSTRMPSFTPFLSPHHQQDMSQLMESQQVPKEEETYGRLSRLGSRPPNCNHKCRGCMPCYPIQVPTTTDQVGLQFTNYEPEGWKCKCGSSVFNP